jgi:hypothetical protein
MIEWAGRNRVADGRVVGVSMPTIAVYITIILHLFSAVLVLCKVLLLSLIVLLTDACKSWHPYI